MGQTQFSFKRYEKKYLLPRTAYEALLPRLLPHLQPDAYHQSAVCSIYYDRPDFTLIRHSIDAPVYKEKLRVRSYAFRVRTARSLWS